MNKINYAELSEIIVRSQKELDAIPDDFAGRIFIEFGTDFSPAIVTKSHNAIIAAIGSSYVKVRGNSSIVAFDNSYIVARDNSRVKARGNSCVVAHDTSTVEARDNSDIVAWDNSIVDAGKNSVVDAGNHSIVVAWDNVSVRARDYSSVIARNNSIVRAYDWSHIESRDNSFVRAQTNSSVVAWDNSFVVAWDISSVKAGGNSQVKNLQPTETRIQLSGNSRIVHNPITIDEYVSFYGIEHDEKTGHFFKAVHRSDDGYFYSDHDPDFRYIVGTTVHQPCDPNVGNECSYGIHITHLDWALDFGATWSNLAIIEVETDLDKVVVPVTGDGKVRTSEVKVLREVPLEKCGAYGEMLARRLGQNKSL